MTDDLYFTIEWRKRRKTIYIDDKPTIDEQHEIVEESILIVESLVYVLTEAAIHSEKCPGDKFALFNNVQTVIIGFCSSALSGLGDLEKRREQLEKTVDRLQTI